MVDLGERSLGMVETRGLVAAVEAADAMLKASEVRLLSTERTEAALITIHVVGEVAAVRAAVDAGRAAAERVGEVVSAHVIPRPDNELGALIDRQVRKATATYAVPDIEVLTVRELRNLAREIPGLPIQGREIARPRKEDLIDMLKDRLGE